MGFPGKRTMPSATVNWANGPGCLRTVNVPIIADGLEESTESFLVWIECAVGATIAVPLSKTETVHDIPAPQLISAGGAEGNCKN